jgi:hypothetical protein
MRWLDLKVVFSQIVLYPHCIEGNPARGQSAAHRLGLVGPERVAQEKERERLKAEQEKAVYQYQIEQEARKKREVRLSAMTCVCLTWLQALQRRQAEIEKEKQVLEQTKQGLRQDLVDSALDQAVVCALVWVLFLFTLECRCLRSLSARGPMHTNRSSGGTDKRRRRC